MAHDIARPGDPRNVPASRPGPSPTASRLLLFAALAVAAVLRVREALRTPMWFDEIFTVWIARLSPRAVLDALAQDVHPPLHFLMVWAWRALGGEGELWLKSLSILIGLATIAVTFALARDLFGRGAAWIAAALLALHPFHIYFSQEVRNYVLLHLLIVLSAWTAWRWMESGRRRDGLWYVLSAAAALYTHYLAGVVLAFLWLWGVFALRADRRRLLHWIGLHVAVAALFSPQLPILITQLARDSEHWIRRSTLAQLVGLARKLSFKAVYMIPPLFVLALLPLLRSRERRGATMLLAITVPPVLLTWVLTRYGAHLFIERYMFFTLPAFCALLAAGCAGIRWGWLRHGATLAVLLFALRSVVLSPPHAEAAALGRAATYLAPRIRPGDEVFCADTHSLFFMRQHLPGLGRQRLLLVDPNLPYYEGARLVPDSLRVSPAALESARARHARWWAVRTRSGGVPSTAAAALFDAAAGRPVLDISMVTVWGGVADSAAAARH